MLIPADPTGFNEAARAIVRHPKARVTVTWTDPYLDASIEAEAPGQENRICYPKQTADLIETVPYKWLHCDSSSLPSSCILWLAFNAWSKGNGSTDKNTGNMPSAPEGAFQNCSFESCGVGEGFVNNSNDGYFQGDGTNAYMQTDYVLSVTGATTNLSFGIIADVTSGVDQYLFGLYDDAGTYFHAHINSARQVEFRINSSYVTARALTQTSAVSAGKHHFIFRIVNGLMEIWIDGSEYSPYSQQTSFTFTKTFTAKLRIADRNGSSLFPSKIWDFKIFNAAVPSGYIAKYYVWGDDFNSKAYNKGDSMHVGAGIAVLSENLHPAPGTEAEAIDYEMGWWGANAGDGNSEYGDAIQTLTLTFSARPVLTLRVVGDDKYNEYPVDFVISVYDDAASLLYTDTITNNNSVIWSSDVTSENINNAAAIILQITKWSDPFRVVKIIECYTSIVSIYDDDEIISLSINEEMEIKDGSLPIGNISCNEMDLSLNNVDDKFFPNNTDAVLHNLVKKNRKIVAEMGFELASGEVQYVALGTFWSGDWRTDENGTTASTSGRDRLELLRKTTFYPGIVYTDYTLKQLATIVLEDAKLIMPDMEYNVDDALSSFVIPYAWFQKKSHFEQLRLISAACLGRTFCDRNGIIQVLGMAIEGSSVYEITNDNYFERTQPAESEDIANVIEVPTSPYIPNDSATTDVYVSSENLHVDIGSKTVWINYKQPPIIEASATLDLTVDDPAGGDTYISSESEYYDWGAKIIVVCPTTPGNFKIKIDGKEFNTDGAITYIAEDEDSIRDYGKQTYELKKNIFIQNEEVATLIAETLLPIYKEPAKDSNLDWRGNPVLELADPVTIPEYVKGAINQKGIFRITRQSLNYDGALRATLEARKIADEVISSYQDTDNATLVWQDTDGIALKIQA